MKKIVIAVDGYSSCGKSTIARQLARQVGYIYIDSGAMYRAITLYFMRNQIDLADPVQVEQALSGIRLSFRSNPSTHHSDIFLNDENIESYIRDLGVASRVSLVAAIPAVREFAVAQQRLLGKEKGIVMDGRDIGTTVFPEAELKLFITADPEVRAQRRYLELKDKQINVTIDEVKKNLLERDEMDTSRSWSPLKKAIDAIEIDTTYMSREEQLEKVLELVDRALTEAIP